MTAWNDIQTKPTNGTPFVSTDDINEIIHNDWNGDERITALEILYSGGGIPWGGAILWFGSEAGIPEGWQLCNGTNGTPDMRGSFVYGATEDVDLLLTGGNNIHLHDGGIIASGGAHPHSVSGSKPTQSLPSSTTGVTGSGSWITANTHGHGITPTIASAGSHIHTIGISGTADGLPPYKKLFWISRIP